MLLNVEADDKLRGPDTQDAIGFANEYFPSVIFAKFIFCKMCYAELKLQRCVETGNGEFAVPK